MCRQKLWWNCSSKMRLGYTAKEGKEILGKECGFYFGFGMSCVVSAGVVCARHT